MSSNIQTPALSNTNSSKLKTTSNKKAKVLKNIIKNYQLYIFLLPAVVYYIIFKYIPMYGIQIAFKDFMVAKGIMGSPWAGLKHFEKFINSFEFWRLVKNTLVLSIGQLAAGFPIPIFLALLLNQLNSKRYKKFVQTVIYAPHFISTVVLVGMMYVFLSPRTGIVNHLITAFGGTPVFFMGKAEWFKPLYILSDIWQNAGWGTIVYLASLSNVSPELHESAIVDGANKWQRVWFIDIPGIIPTAVVLLILSTGRIVNIGFEKAYLMQTPLNLPSAEIVSTYVYKVGLLGAQFSYSAAVGFLESVINLVLLFSVNKISQKLTETSLF